MIKVSQKYKDMVHDSDFWDDWNDCSVIALAISAGWPYMDAQEALWKTGRRQGTGATIRQSIEALEAAKVKHTVIAGHMLEMMTVQAGIKVMTVNQFAKINNMKNTTYQIMINGHIFAMIDGVVHDFENSGKHRVLCAIELFNTQKITTDQLVETMAPLPKPTFKEQGQLFI